MIPIVLLCLIANLANADGTGKKESNANLVDSIMLERRQIIKEYIQLTEAEEQQFWPIYDEFQSEMRVVTEKSVILFDKFTLKTDSLTDMQTDDMIDELLDIQTVSIEIQKRYAKKFRKILPPKKALLLIDALLRPE